MILSRPNLIRLGIPSALLIGVVLVAFWFCGSLTNGWRYLRGERVILTEVDLLDGVNRSQQLASALPDGSVPSTSQDCAVLELRNLSSSTVKILGHDESCACTSVEQLPDVLRPWQAATVRLGINKPRKSEVVFLVFTSSVEQPVVSITFPAVDHSINR